MKNFVQTVTVILCLSVLLLPTKIWAQDSEENEETVIETNLETFELKVTPGIQSIFDKSIPLTLNIKSNVDTHRMQIRWELPTGIEAVGSYTTNWGAISKGEKVSTIITVKPNEPGTYNIVAEVQDWRTNEVDTENIELTFDNNLELSPQSDEYYRNKRAWFWARIGIGIIGLTAILILGYFGYRAFRKWLEED